MSHLMLMVIHAALIGAFFSLLWRRQWKAQLFLFLKIFLGLSLGAVALGWLMYFFPSGPPAPLP
ncbi:MAG: hypothetical protein AAGD38_01285 [Acidobacteriota bacterium]